jgi:hypothetical protein
MDNPATFPIVVHSGQCVVEPLVPDIIKQRGSSFGDVTNAEVLCYLSTASLSAPLDSDAYAIFMNMFAKWCRWKGKPVPDFVEDRPLSDYQEGIVRRIKSDIRAAQLKQTKGRRVK